MTVTAKDIAGLKNKKYYETSNEKIVLMKDYEKVIHSPTYTVLGFLNGYMYSSTGTYLVKSTAIGESIAELKIEIDHASFVETFSYFYAWKEKTVYKISDNLETLWSASFEDEIKSVVMDGKGAFYVVFKSSRDIRKFLPDGSELAYIDGSDDPNKDVRLFDCFVSKGAGWFYVLGSEYWDYDNKVQVFIDKYDARTWDKKERIIVDSNINIDIEDEEYHFDDFYINGDYIYIYGEQYVSKINIKGIQFWKYMMGYNTATGTFDKIGHIEFSDNKYTEYLYFAEDLYSSNGHSFGKLSVNGNLLWKITMTDCIEDVDFKFCTYQDKIYTTNKALVQTKKGYILSLDDNHVLFRTRDNHLVEIIEYNSDELYSPDNFYGSYLLADTIKDGVPKIVYHPLLHDDGDIINEDREILLLPEENFNYTDPENYEYKKLLCSNYSLNASDFSILYAKNYKPLMTKLKNVLKTKLPYLPDRTHEYILSMPGDRIDTMQDMDLIRSRFNYSYDRFLLADRNMFFTDIITKDLGFTLITKKDGHDIVRKTREIYTYVLNRFDDLSLIEEWLKENGVLDTALPKYVDEIRHHTVSAIQDIQIAGTPNVYDVGAYKQHEYTFDGTEYINNTWGTQIFSCTNLPFDKRRCFKKAYIDSIANLVERQEMRPIMLFLNGKAIKWSDCTIVRDWSYTYVVIKNTNPRETDLSCVIFPCDIRYGEDNNCLPEETCNTHLYFTKNGELTNDRSKVSFRVEIIDANVVGETLDYSKGYVEVKNLYNQKASEKNILVFENNLLFPESRFYMQDHGKDIFTYLRDTKKSTFKTFYWIKSNSYYGILNKVNNGSLVKDEVVAGTKGQSTEMIDNFRPPFDFKLYRSKTWAENVAQAVEYIMSYDMSLLVKYYKQMSGIQSYVFKGDYLRDRVPKDGGWLIMPRSRKSKYDDFIMVFKNNELYEYYKEIEYDSHNFKIPIFNHVDKTDIIEIVHFKEVDNSYYSLTITDDKVDYLPEGLRYDNFLLFGNSPTGKQYYDTFSVENSTQYDIDFAYKNNFNNGKYVSTQFKIKDEYYKGKSINICSKRQFRYMYYNIFYDRSSINLSPDFRFCHDKSKYMVFKNDIILPRDEWNLNVMTNESPHKYISITFADELCEGDRIDIFYLPMSYDEVDITGDIDMDQLGANGDILISNNHLGYSFDKDLFMIGLNGLKLNYQWIENIDNHRFRIKVEEMMGGDAETYGIIELKWYLYRFMQPDKLLNKLFSYSDKWSDAVDALTPEEYAKLLVQKTKV